MMAAGIPSCIQDTLTSLAASMIAMMSRHPKRRGQQGQSDDACHWKFGYQDIPICIVQSTMVMVPTRIVTENSIGLVTYS